LYDQFNYGEISPLAIYEFMRFMVEKGHPAYLFLIGKGRDVNAGFHRLNNQGAEIYKDLVPSAGMPGSDMNYTVGLAGTTYEPAVPTGRLSVTTPTEVASYLNKIKEIENPNVIQDWQKQGLHLSGGIRDYELPVFRSYLDGFKSTAEGIYWGGNISTIAKREPSQIELINIADKINEGINLVTFYGHSSPGTIDIDIGKVTDPELGYNNAGKYPVFLINGCNAGSFFLNGELFGEDWINAANRGARNFIAHSFYGFESTLRRYSDFFYRIGFADSVFIKKGVGDLQKEVARQYMQSAPPTMKFITQVQQMVLLGDPAVRLFQYSDPDYEITDSSLSLFSFDGKKTVTSLTDSFAIRIVVRNMGIVKNKPVKVKVTRTFRDGSTASYDSIFAPLFYQDTLLFKIFRGVEDGAGDNTFLVGIDPENEIKELNEENNQATYTISISSSATLNLFPIAYGIVPQTTVKFIWQSSDPFSANRDFQLEADTTLSFTSPFTIKKVVSGKVIANTIIELLNRDSTVYYWRTRFDKPAEGESTDWSVSSFSYIKDSGEGWAQIRKDQTRENFFSELISDGEGSPFRFEETRTSVEVITFGINYPLPVTDVSVKINGSEYNLATQGQPCRNNTLNLIAFNKRTAVPYAGLPFNFQDPRTCGREPQLINSFALSELETGFGNDLAAFVNAVGISDSVVLFSIGDPGYTSWSSLVKAKLGELGVGLTDLNSLQAGEPVIIFGKKGAAPGTAAVFRTPLSPTNEQLITVAKEITGRKSEGMMKSVLIGPAQEWREFIRSTTSLEASDEVTFLIYGVNDAGEETLITDNADNEFDLSNIPVDEFPYLRVVYNAKDEINLTPADWKNWIVLYEPVAEGVLFYDGTLDSQTVQEGQRWSTRFGFVNISEKNFSGPLKVELDVVTQATQHRLQKDSVITAPAPGLTTFFNVYTETEGMAGINDVYVYVNRKEVPEQYYDNNFANLPGYLLVQADKTRPVLEVTIDGRQIRNGDFVSSSPLIQLTLEDENDFILKTDTLDVNILLSYPCGAGNCPFKRIPLSSSSINLYPATLTSDFRVDFTPADLTDGEYILQVEAADASGNFSGVTPYQISFNVKSETTLNFNGVYPNPSSTGFFFNFELTGNTLPEVFSLEVFSPTGQLVTRFGVDDVQQFYIGTNEIIWNGTDASGKVPTNGVYLYRLRIKAGEIDSVNTGKLVWLR
jgi:Peptidase family C25